ncbi:uncharacterized protein LOC120795454 [Xiphias gladius]|uniref:uncharacterized protein LOC120795454 n=1 Tax=Xiphias gladius TaxID=8245 RepID=UPI001A988C55|nr:uncharacterized protein LOC120795454 [Xiphias gladius]
MENPMRRTYNRQKISFIPKFSQVSFNSDGHFNSRYEIFGQDGDGSNRRAILCLGLLNVVLLIVAVVIGINCAKVKEGSVQVSHSAATQLVNELDYLRNNHSDVIEAEEEAKKALERALKNHAKLKVQIEQQKTINDNYQRQIEGLRAEKTNLQSNISALEGSCGRCLSGWILLDSTCYFISYSEAPAVKKNWPDSRADCISRGADLVVIDNREEQKFVSDTIQNKKTSSKRSENGFWIGLTDIEEEGTWVWINNVTELEQRYWMDGEPNNIGHKGENCGVAVYSSSNPWKTRFDGPCHGKKLHWICEIPCAKAKDLQIPYSVLHNSSDIIRANLEAQAALKRERTSHLQLKLLVKHRKTVTDGLQRQMESLQTEKTNLKINRTTLESRQTALISTVKMEDKENADGTFEATYNKLICQENISTDEHPLYPNQEKRQVSMSMVRPESCMNHYRLLAVSLAVLAVILLAVDIGLGVYYNKLTGGHHTIRDINSEMAKLQDTYNTAIQRKDEMRKQLARELTEQQRTKWELEHQTRRNKDYEKQTENLQYEVAVLRSHLPMIEEGCRHCLPGWTLMNSVCYFFAFSDAMPSRSWLEARNFCKKQGGDLAIIDSTEKHLAVSELINNYRDATKPITQSGFWIGLRDIEEEGMWKWLDGTKLIEGYWNDGEPNNQYGEDCAATYPRDNPFKAWNDAPCNYELKWICEMAPRSAG